MASPISMSSELLLHIWPARWNLHSIHPSCLAAVIYLQQAAPGKFTVIECNNPDLSPSGQLPFLIHDQHTVSSLGPIMKYVAGLKHAENGRLTLSLDASLNSLEKSQAIAWCAHVESNLGDIVSHALYSHNANWVGLTHPALASMYTIPQRYYIPRRVRQVYKPRLEAAGLWNTVTTDQEEKKPFKENEKTRKEQNAKIFHHAFSRKKVLENARASLDLYARLVGDREFIYRDRPTTLDIILASHILLLSQPAYPDPFIKDLIMDAYPMLASHARRVYDYGANSAFPISPAHGPSWNSLIPWPPTRKQTKQSGEDAQFTKIRWGFFTTVTCSFALYLTWAMRRAMSLKASRIIRENPEENEG